MSSKPSAGFAWCCAGTILLGSFLLFQVQPMISKMILPWFGGTPAVWTTCMLFFQMLLLAGYAYADFLVALKRPARQLLVHGPLLLLALALLPITPADSWKPDDSRQSTQRILVLLLANVGLPYFLLAANAPLVQTWFARVYAHRSPYRLYALSNIGSLVALLSYPFLVEPWLATGEQGRYWSLAFLVFGLATAGMLFMLKRLSTAADSAENVAEEPDSVTGRCEATSNVRPTWSDRAAWLLLPALGSVMLLAMTNHLCQDVAVVPFLWILPLSLYLLSFIICFDREAWYVPRWFGIAAAISILFLCNLIAYEPIERLFDKWKIGLSWTNSDSDPTESVLLQSTGHLLVLFLVCMVCHGELVRRKPVAGRLTSFYLMVSAGGALGGAFVALVCPMIFNSYFELNLALMIAFCLAAAVVLVEGQRKWFAGRPLVFAASCVAALGGVGLVTWAQVHALQRDYVEMKRGFYGVLRVSEMYADSPDLHGKALYNGRILHGYQLTEGDRRGVATTYYDKDSGVGLAIRRLDPYGPKRIGVVGLGAGTIAALAQPGDYVRFYEINPLVEELSSRHFSFRQDSGATCEVVLGDARVSMERELALNDAQQFDVLALDAFSGDAIPAHLITREAFAVYERHMFPDGVIAFHISNRYLDLVPIVVGLAEHYHWKVINVEFDPPDDWGTHTASSDWMLLTRNPQFLQDFEVKSASYVPDLQDQKPILWTDQYSDLWSVMHPRRSYRPQLPGAP